MGKQIIVTPSGVKEELKSEYIKTNGAICTPEYIVDIIQANAIKLDSINNKIKGSSNKKKKSAEKEEKNLINKGLDKESDKSNNSIEVDI